MIIDENEYLSWLEEQAKVWEDRAEKYYDCDVGYKFVAQGYTLAIKSCIWKFKSLQQKKGEGR